MAKQNPTATAPAPANKPAKTDPTPTKAKGKEAEGEDEEDEAEKVQRVAYTAAEVSAADRGEDGRLKCVPTAFDGKLHLAPKKGDFVDEADFLDFRAAQAETRANELVERAARDRENATAIRKYGDPAQRAAIAKRQKMLAELAALEQGLIAEGVELPPPPMVARKTDDAPSG